jgi:hypothetical protein
MGPVRKSPEGNQEPVYYELPRWAWFSTFFIQFIVFIILFWVLGSKIPSEPMKLLAIIRSVESMEVLVVGAFGVSGSIFLHESAHYLTAKGFGHNPDYIWPTSVKFGSDLLRTRETVVPLLAPQILSILYLLPLYYGVSHNLELILWIGFAINFLDGSKDVAWSVRRLTWPRGTVVILGENGENFVSFPEK